MRSMFFAILLLIGLVLSGTSYALNAPSVQGGRPDNWYTEVVYTGTGAAVSAEHGNVLAWDTTAHDGYTVTKVNTAESELVAGIVPVSDDTAHNLANLGRPLKTGDVFLMQVKGYVKDLPTDGNAAAGQALGSEANWGNSTGDGDGMGVALETDSADTASPSGTSGDVYLNIGAGQL